MRSLRFHLAAAVLALAVPASAFASSHSEAPGTVKDRLADDTDVYVYVAKNAPNAVTFVGNWVPLLEPNGGPNFYGFDEDATYYINIDNVGDCLDHIRYQFRFKTTRRTGATFLYNTGVVTTLDDPDLNVRQTYTLTRYDNGAPTVLLTDAPVAPNFVGPVSMPSYNQLASDAIQTLGDGTRVFVGPRDDPFFVDLGAVFDLLTIRNVPGDQGGGVDGVSNYNVLSIVLQIPKTRLTKDGQAPSAELDNHIIGLYDSAERPQTRTLNADGTTSVSGSPIQVSRLGHPLVNEVVIPLQDKDKFNASKPTGDGAFLSYITDPELARLFKLLYDINSPAPPRTDLVTIFLTGIPGLNQPDNGTACEMLRLNMAIPPTRYPKRLGVLAGDLAGFPNGRRLGDDVVDIEERAVAGATPFTPNFNVAPNNRLGDGIDSNDKPFMAHFPYLAPPHNPLSLRGHRRQKNTGRGHDARTLEPAEHELEYEAEESEEIASAGSASSVSEMVLVSANPTRRPVVEYTVARDSRVTLKVFDVQGRAIRTLVDYDAAAGSFRSAWDGNTDDGSFAGKGVYFVRFAADGVTVSSRKVVIQ